MSKKKTRTRTRNTSEPHWEYLTAPEKMENTSDVMLKVFAHRGFTDEELLAREGLQNCQDARSEAAKEGSNPVMVTLDRKVVVGEEKRKLFGALQLTEQASNADLLFDQNLLEGKDKKKAFRKYLSDDTPVSVVTVADGNTVGLGGALRFDGTENDFYCHFKRLVLSLGQSEKPEGGGSFGFGKTVFAKLSAINLVLFYSRFEPTPQSGGASARFMGVWLLRKDLSKGFSGFAFFGQKAKGGTSDPFVDDDAHYMAEQCGMQLRGKTDLGTTVAVIDCSLKMPAVKFAVERYWWPSISDGKLSVRIIDEGQHLDVRPFENPLVQPYLEMYGALKRKHDKPSDVKIDEPFNRVPRVKLNIGQMAIRVFNQEKIEEMRKYAQQAGVAHDLLHPVGGGAKIREPGMVIKYEDASTMETDTAVGGIFLADDNIDAILRASEPSSHDDWDSTEKQRLEEAGLKLGLCPGQAIEVVTSVNRRIARRLMDARRELTPPPPSEDARLQILEKMLSDLFQAGERPGGFESDPRPFSIKTTTSNAVSNGRRTNFTDITLTLNQDFDGTQLDCDLQVEGKVLEGPGSAAGRSVAVTLTHNNQTKTSDKPQFRCTLKHGTAVRLTAQAECGKKEVVRFIVKAMNPNI
jgi:hypothetical protein